MIPNAFTLSAIQESFRDIYAKIKPLQIGNMDLSKRRIINAGKSIEAFDYVTRFELDERTKSLAQTTSVSITGGPLSTSGAVRIGTFATRGAAAAHAQETFYASDHAYVAWVSDGAAWNYSSGVNAAIQSGISAIAALLGTKDLGYLLAVTDFTHTLKWSGSAWDFIPGDGSGQIAMFAAAPNGGTWGLCDGSTYTFLKADGTTGSFVTPNYGTAAYLKLGTSATIGPTAASGATAAVSAGTPAGTVTAPVFTGDAASSVANTALGADNAVAYPYTPTGTNSAPTFTGSALSTHSHGPNTLELRQSLLIGFFRR